MYWVMEDGGVSSACGSSIFRCHQSESRSQPLSSTINLAKCVNYYIITRTFDEFCIVWKWSAVLLAKLLSFRFLWTLK